LVFVPGALHKLHSFPTRRSPDLNLARHLVFNAEILITKNFNLRVGYNYNRRQQLKIEELPGAAGITYGLGMRIANPKVIPAAPGDRKSTRLNSSHVKISYAVCCL